MKTTRKKKWNEIIIAVPTRTHRIAYLYVWCLEVGRVNEINWTYWSTWMSPFLHSARWFCAKCASIEWNMCARECIFTFYLLQYLRTYVPIVQWILQCSNIYLWYLIWGWHMKWTAIFPFIRIVRSPLQFIRFVHIFVRFDVVVVVYFVSKNQISRRHSYSQKNETNKWNNNVNSAKQWHKC